MAASAWYASFRLTITSPACPDQKDNSVKRNVLIIGAGGVAHVVAHKCAQHNLLLGDIHIASRTPGKCQAIIDSIWDKRSLQGPGVLQEHALDALDVEATSALIRQTRCQIVINVGTLVRQ